MENKNNFLIIGLIIVLVIGVGAYFLFGQDNQETSLATPQPLVESMLTSEEEEEVSEAPKTYTLAEVSKHDNKDDCWLVIEGGVYDATPFIAAGQHPGKDAILEGCGIDGQQA